MGQADADADFVVRAPACTMLLDATGATVQARESSLRMTIVGGDPDAQARGEAALPGHSNYYRGNDPSKWVTDVPQFARVRYAAVYPGIDLVYHGSQQQLEYDFVVEPGVDPSCIAMRFDGSVALEAGGLVLRTDAGELRQRAPVAYQERDGRRDPVESAYCLGEDGTVSFELGEYDRERELVIDPVVSYATYYGGASDDRLWSVELDGDGNLFVVGGTSGTDLPGISPDAFQPTSNGGVLVFLFNEAYLLKLSSDGQTILYATYFGGSGADEFFRLDIDSDGNAIVCGYTESTDLPVLSAHQPTSGGGRDAFLAKFDNDGSLLFSTYLGGSAKELAYDVGVDASGDIVVVGETRSSDLPVAAALFPTKISPPLAADAFIAKYTASGTAVYATYFGGPKGVLIYAVDVDDAGSAYVTGLAVGDGAGFPLVNPAPSPNLGGGQVTFASKINSDGSAIVYSSLLGGSGSDAGLGVAVDAAGNAYFAGQTDSADFPVQNALQPTIGGGFDAYVVKLAPNGDLLYSTFFGGSSNEGAFLTDVQIDSAGRPWISSSSNSTDLTLVDPVQPASAGLYDSLLFRLDAAGAVVEFATLLGGSASERWSEIALTPDGSVYLGCSTESTDFPVENAIQPVFGGGSYEVAITKLEFDQDGDGLPDLWEEHGFTAADGTFVNLPAMGAKVDRKDIFVEIDYMTGHKPVDLQAVVDAFAAAPVLNPDGSYGISLHCHVDDEIDCGVDDEIPFTDPLGGTALSGKYEWNGTDETKTYFQDIKDHPDYGLTPSLKKVAHYCVFADTIDFGDGTLSGISREVEEGEIAGSDFIVSLGAVGVGGVGSIIQQRGTFMHELGHNLGLRHGGGDSDKRKPNYLSVMNYFFQLEGLDCGADGICVDFSRQELPTLNEDDLDETVGIGGVADRGTAMQNGSASDVRRIADASGAIDWNEDGDKTDTGLVLDLNGDNVPIEYAVEGSIFVGFNDWENLVFKGGSIGAPGASAPPPQPDTTEPPEEIDLEIFASLGPPVPTGLKGHSADPQTTLTWKPGANVTYNVYRTQAGDIEFLGNTTQSNYHDKTAEDGVEYVYSVASVNQSGTEGPSTSVTVVAR